MHRSVKQNYSEFGEDKPREYWATIAIVAASAISAGSGAYSASQAGGGGAGGSRRPPNFVQPPEPAYERALRHYTTRLLAQGAASVPPSFLDYVASGGTAKFDLGNTQMSPQESLAVGQFGHGGKAPPWVQPGQTQRTLDQLVYIANLPKGAIGAGAAGAGIRKGAAEYKKLQMLEGEDQTPRRQKREAGLKQKLSKTGFGPYV